MSFLEEIILINQKDIDNRMYIQCTEIVVAREEVHFTVNYGRNII